MEINELLKKMTEKQEEFLSNIAAQLIDVRHDQWTGQVSFEINIQQGTPVTMYVTSKESLIKPIQRRKVRSRGAR